MRRYRVWAGSPKGSPERPDRCVIEVPDGGRSVLFHQCERNRGKGDGGLYCGLHAKWDEKRRAHHTPPPEPDHAWGVCSIGTEEGPQIGTPPSPAKEQR